MGHKWITVSDDERELVWACWLVLGTGVLWAVVGFFTLPDHGLPVRIQQLSFTTEGLVLVVLGVVGIAWRRNAAIPGAVATLCWVLNFLGWIDVIPDPWLEDPDWWTWVLMLAPLVGVAAWALSLVKFEKKHARTTLTTPCSAGHDWGFEHNPDAGPGVVAGWPRCRRCGKLGPYLPD